MKGFGGGGGGPMGGRGSGLKGPDENIAGHAYDARLMKRLLSHLRGVRGWVVLATFVMLGGTALDLTVPLIIKRGIDNHISSGQLDGLGTLAIYLIGILIVAFGLQYCYTYLTQWIGQKVILGIRTKLFDHLQRMDLKFIDSRPVGWWMTRITSDVQNLNEMFTSGVVSIIGDLFALTGILVIMLWLNWKLALVTFIVLPLLILVVVQFRKRVQVQFRVIREALAILMGYMQEHISGVRTVQLFGKEQPVVDNFESRNRVHRDAYIKTIRYFAIFFPSVTFLGVLAQALILLTGGIMIVNGNLSWGALVAFIAYAERFFRPIRDLSERYNTMQSAMISAERVFWLMDSKPDIADPTPSTVEPKTDDQSESKNTGKIVFDSVGFEYNIGEPVLKDVSFRVNEGETVAIVGATGAGKTTLISLLLRFYDVTSGGIFVNGRDIRQIPLKELRNSFGVVLQDVFLFSGTIRENVTLGDLFRDEETLRNALKEANALSFVEELPKGVDEPVGERGARLSGGQKQLLAIARALAANPPVLLLDEATAAIDTETEIRIQTALDRLMAGRTTLVVAHRLSTIRKADKVIVLHKGKVRETGTHQELLTANGIYARLYRLQYAQQNGVPSGVSVPSGVPNVPSRA